MRSQAVIQAAIAPMTAWQKMFSNPTLEAIQKNRFASATVGDLVTEIFKKPVLAESATVMDAFLKQDKSRTIVGKPLNWATIAAIAGNQRRINCLLANAFPQTIYDKQKDFATLFTPALAPNFWNFTNKVHSLQLGLAGIGKQIALKGLAGVNAKLLETFEKTTQEAIAITEKITQTEYATQESIAKLETFIGTSLQKFMDDVSDQIKATGKSPVALIGLWVGILGILFTIFSMAQTYLAQNQQAPQAATKESLKELKTFIGIRFEEALKSSATEAVLRIDCNLRSRPVRKSKGFFRIGTGATVHIMDAKRKWVGFCVKTFCINKIKAMKHTITVVKRGMSEALVQISIFPETTKEKQLLEGAKTAELNEQDHEYFNNFLTGILRHNNYTPVASAGNKGNAFYFRVMN